MSMPDNTAPDPRSTEPAMKIGTIMAAVTTGIALLVAFGLKLSPDQTAAILGFTAAVCALVQAWWTRRKVWAPATVAKLLRGEDLNR